MLRGVFVTKNGVELIQMYDYYGEAVVHYAGEMRKRFPNFIPLSRFLEFEIDGRPIGRRLDYLVAEGAREVRMREVRR